MAKSVKYLCCALVLILGLFEYSNGDNCQIDGVTEIHWLSTLNIPIVDTHEGEIFGGNHENIIRITSVSFIETNFDQYANVALTDRFSITLLDKFKSYEEFETLERITITIAFECTAGPRTLTIFVNIQDTNNHSPVFSDANFKYKIYTPMSADFPISQFFGDMIVRDIDLTNHLITTDMEPNEYLKLSHLRVDPASKKNHLLDLRTAKLIPNLNEPITISFTVTDVDTTGDPRRTTSGTVTIESDPELEIPVTPIFEDAFYKGVYENNDVKFEKNMILSQGYETSVIFAITGEYSIYFDVTSIGNNVEIKLKAPIPNDIIQNTSFMLFTLTATNNDVVGSSAIHVAFPKDHPSNVEHPLFESAFYSGVHENASVVLNGEIKLSQGYDNSAIFTLKGEYETYFEAVDNNNNIDIIIKSPIPENIIENNDFMLFTLSVLVKNLTGSTAINIAFPKDIKVIKFKQPSFEGDYSKDHILNHPPIELIEGYSTDIVFTLDDESMKYFKISNIQERVIIEKLIDLPQNILNANTFLNIIIKANDNKLNVAYATLTIKLPDREFVSVRFKEPSYQGEYTNDHIINQPSIILEEGYNEGILFTIDEESQKYFTIRNNLENVYIEKKGDLPQDILDTHSFLNIIIKASDGGLNSGFTTFTLKLPKIDTVSLKFKEPSYIGNYSIDHVITHPLIHLEKGYNDKVSFSLDIESELYFKISNAGEFVTIDKKVDLPQIILDTQSFLNIIIKASENSFDAYTTLTIILPVNEVRDFKFKQPSYEGKYSAEHVLTIPEISIDEGYHSGLTFSIQEEARMYFTISNNNERVTISKIQNLPQNIIDVLPFYNLIITANDVTRMAFTTLTLTLPGTNNITLPTELKFANQNYVGSYLEAGQVSHPNIRLSEGFNNGVAFVIEGDMSRYFGTTSVNEEVTVTVKEKLPQQILDNNTYLLIVIWARSIGSISGFTTVSIDLPNTEIGNLKFRQPSYEGTYSAEHILTIPEISIDEGYHSGLTFSIQEEARMYFTISNNNERVTISKLQNLPQNIIDVLPFYNLIITANDVSRMAFTTLTLTLPGTNNITLPTELKFANQNYVGSYSEAGQVSHPNIRLSEGFNNGVVFVIEGDMSRYFGTTSVNEEVTLTVKEKLPQQILDNNTYLLIVIWARSIGSISGFTTVSIDLPNTEIGNLKFRQPSYEGTYSAEHVLTIPEISIDEGYHSGLTFSIQEEARVYFTISNNNERVTILKLQNLPQNIIDVLPFYNLIITANDVSRTAFTTLTLALPGSGNVTLASELRFTDQNYVGLYTEAGQVSHPEIRLSEGYNNRVVFVIEGDMSRYFGTTSINERVTLTVKEKLPQEILDNEIYLVVVIWARSIGSISGFTTVLIDLPFKEIINLQFRQPSYQGSYDDEHKVNHPEIQLTNGFSSKVKFLLQDDAAVYFNINNNQDRVTITTRTNLPQEILNTNAFLNIIIIADDNEADIAFTTLTLTLPKIENCTAPSSLVFSEQAYTGEYKSDNQLTHPEIRLSEGYRTGVVYIIEGEMSEYFDVNPTNEVVKIIVKTNLPQQFLEANAYLNLIIWARSLGSISGFTALSIDLPDTVITKLEFGEPFYEGTYNEDHVVSHGVIILEEGYSDDVIFTIPLEAQTYFSITNDKEKVTITKKINLPPGILDTNSYLNIVIWAQNRLSTRAFTTLTLSLFGTENLAPPNTLRFAQPIYLAVYSKSNELSHPVIRLIEGYNDGVVFTIEGDMAQYFDIRSSNEVVTIIVKSNLPQEVLIDETYVNLVLWARSLGAVSGFSTITIDLPNIAEIGEFPSLVVTRIFENQVYDDILNLFIMDCEYEITDSWPRDQIWFKMQNGKLACSEVDRENETIAFLPKSQVQVELTCVDKNREFNEIPITLHDPKEYIMSKLRKSAVCEVNTDNKDWIYTGHVYNTPSKRLVSIIIEDENDNSPDFGIAGTLVVGYPNRDLVTFARPASLTTVHATDLDICYHAEIRYSTDNDYFNIHPKSGTISPKNNALIDLEDSFIFKVTATDEDGHRRSTDLEIMVKLLDLEHVVFISVENALLENTELIVDDMSSKLPANLHYLTSFVMPLGNDNANKLKNIMNSKLELVSDEDNVDSSLGIFIYAFDNDKNLLDASNLLTLIKDNIQEDDIPWTYEGLPLSDSNIYDIRSTHQDNVGLIVGVSILSVITFLLIVGIIVWFLVIMPKRYQRLTDSQSSGSYASSVTSNDSKEELEDDTSSNKDNPVTLEIEENTAEPYANYAYVNEATNPEKVVNENKSVSFKETVQQIDILDYIVEDDPTGDDE